MVDVQDRYGTGDKRSAVRGDDGAAARALPRIAINGKFYSGPLNGVHRVADRLIRQLDALAAEGAGPQAWRMELLVPECETWAPSLQHIRQVRQRHGHTQRWEQLILPLVARDALLVSFANLAPSLHRNKLTMVHDAQFLLSPRSYPPKLRWGYRALIPAGARTSRRVLSVSEYARDTLATFGIADHARSAVLYNGADHILDQPADQSVLTAHALEPQKYCVVFGSASFYKNVQVVFQAFSHPELAHLKLAVVGPERSVLERAGLPVPPAAVFVGAVDDGRLRALYESALCLVFPSRTEGFGLPPVEAMMVGCPVVAAPAGAMPEICRDTILYADVEDPASWAAAVIALADDRQLRAAKQAGGAARARHFTWRAAGQRLVGHISDLLQCP